MTSYIDKRANKYVVDKNGIGHPTYDSYNNNIVIIYKKDWFEKFLDFIILITKIARFMCVIAFIIIKIIYIVAFIYIKLSGNTKT